MNIILLLLLWIPNLHSKRMIFIVSLYLLESYMSNTRQYLQNSIPSTFQLEQYLENLRQIPPVIQWKVQCFHYQKYLAGIIKKKLVTHTATTFYIILL